jgi:hypothetical protein
MTPRPSGAVRIRSAMSSCRLTEELLAGRARDVDAAAQVDRGALGRVRLADRRREVAPEPRHRTGGSQSSNTSSGRAAETSALGASTTSDSRSSAATLIST